MAIFRQLFSLSAVTHVWWMPFALKHFLLAVNFRIQLLKESSDVFLLMLFIVNKRAKLNVLKVSAKLARIVKVICPHLTFVFKVPYLRLRLAIGNINLLSCPDETANTVVKQL